jgi:hypothetical protein
MIHLQWGRALMGGLAGLVIGIIFGVNRVVSAFKAELAIRGFKPDGAVGWDINVFLRSPLFWSIVLICTLTLGYLAGRTG